MSPDPLLVPLRAQRMVRGVVAANGFPPVSAFAVAAHKNGGRYVQVPVGIEGRLRGVESFAVVAPVHLHETNVDGVLTPRKRLAQGRCRGVSRGVVAAFAVDVQSPGPRTSNSLAFDVTSALGERHGVEDLGRNAVRGGDLVVAWRYGGIGVGGTGEERCPHDKSGPEATAHRALPGSGVTDSPRRRIR